MWAEAAVSGKWPATAAMGVAEFFAGAGRMPTESEQARSWLARDSLARALGWMGAEDNRCWPTGGGCVLTRALVSPPSTWTPFDACVADEIVALNGAAEADRLFFKQGGG
jgi:hypothetical protein